VARVGCSAQYAELKTSLARQHPHDREQYTEAKREFIEAVLGLR
jgi:GrpB-like predicted nucleotidyltransferase (UPF0157 family)